MAHPDAAMFSASVADLDPAWGHFETHHAFIVGIDSYANGIAPLRTAANDARRLGELLAEPTRRDRFSVHQPLINGDATGARVRDLLRSTMVELVGPDDRVLFYFAGHGLAADGDDGPAGYLVPSDASPGDLSSFIAMTDLQAALDALPCRHLLVILDCCFSGAFRWSSQYRAFDVPKRIYRERFDRFVQDAARQVITSAAHDQKALDVLAGKATGDRGVARTADGVEHSPFALALFNALDGHADAKLPDQQEGDGVITATELYSYIRDQVEPDSIAENERLRQTPSFFPLRNHDKGEFLFLHPRHRLNLPEMDPGDSPYKGLESFNERDAHLFYGRDDVVAKLRLRAEDAEGRLIVVTGASGTGKSSAIKAGLLPQLRAAKFNILPVMRPGEHPLASLEAALLGAVAPAVLVVDQMEEVITRCADPGERQQFDERLAALLDAGDPVARIVLTVRSDFEPQVNHGALAPRWAKARFTVPPFSATELREVVLMPAVQASMIFDPPKLVDQIVEEVVQSPGALPLLSYALSELYLAYQKRGGEGRALTQADYDKLRGVRGALTTKADALHDGMDPAQRDVMRRIMLRMVSLEGDLAGKRVATGDLAVSAADARIVEGVVDRLVESRLVVRGDDADFIEPAHDALVRAWPKLRQWIDDKGRDTLMLASRVAAAAEEHARAPEDGLLWNNNPNLAAVEKELKQGPAWFNLREQAFIRRSAALKKRRFRIGVFVTACVVVALAGVAAVAWKERNEAVRAAAIARAGELAATAETVAVSSPDRSVLLAVEAKRVWPVARADGLLRAAESAYPYRWVLRGHDADVGSAQYSPDGTSLLTASSDETARLWDAATGSVRYVLNGHEGAVWSARFSPDGKTVLTASEDNTARLWDATTGRASGVVMTHDGELKDGQLEGVQSAEFSPDGKTVLTAGRDWTARLWDAATGLPLQVLRGHRGELSGARFSPDGRTVVTVSNDNTARLWDAATGRESHVLGHGDHVLSAWFSRDGKTVVTASADKTARIWDAIEGRELRVLRGHADLVWSAQLSPDGKIVLTASSDKTARLWDAATGRELHVLRGHDDKLVSAQFSADGKTVLTASDDETARLWDAATGLELRVLRGHAGPVNSAQFSADGKTVLTASVDMTARLWDAGIGLELGGPQGGYANSAQFSPDSATVLTASPGASHLWEAATGREVRVLGGQRDDGRVEIAQFSADGKTVLTTARDNTARLWAVATGLRLQLFRHVQEDEAETGREREHFFGAQLSPDGQTVFTADADAKTARLWNAVSGEEVAVLKGPHETLQSTQFSPDGKTLLITRNEDKGAVLWSTVTGQALRRLTGHTQEVMSARFSADGKTVLTASVDGTARLWNADNGATKAILTGHTGVVESAEFSPDGKTVLTASWDKTARLWDAETGRELRALLGHADAVSNARFSPDGKTVLTASRDKTARLWDTASGHELRALRGHAGAVTIAHFSPDGKRVLTVGSGADRARLWDCPECLPSARLAEELARKVGRTLTAEERNQYGLPPASATAASAVARPFWKRLLP